jgi:hypothetical protein
VEDVIIEQFDGCKRYQCQNCPKIRSGCPNKDLTLSLKPNIKTQLSFDVTQLSNFQFTYPDLYVTL